MAFTGYMLCFVNVVTKVVVSLDYCRMMVVPVEASSLALLPELYFGNACPPSKRCCGAPAAATCSLGLRISRTR